ncbi:MAG: tyrosine-type recombinase/integrase [Elainellaceae cyanobacterium]
MYFDQAKTPTGKNSKGTVSIITSHGRLQLRLRQGGKRCCISLGLADGPINRQVAEMKAREIELDILAGHFDQSLSKYKLKSAEAIKASAESSETMPPLDTLWNQFLQYKQPQCSPSTMHKQYGVQTRYLQKLPTYDLSKAVEIRDHIVQNISPISAKRLLIRFSACCKWAVQSGLISENPFQGMASQLSLPKSSGRGGFGEINPFSAEERDLIIQTIQEDKLSSKYSKFKLSYYATLVFFLFHTGCRFSEVIGLQAKHISDDNRRITFEQAVVESKDGLVCKKGLKTQERRAFPCNARMQSFLQTIKHKNMTPSELLFPSPHGKWIRSGNFRNRIWKPTLEYLNLPYRKPYQTRHTFITLALESGLEAKDVARLVGNSPEIIYRHYAGQKREIVIPEF